VESGEGEERGCGLNRWRGGQAKAMLVDSEQGKIETETGAKQRGDKARQDLITELYCTGDNKTLS